MTRYAIQSLPEKSAKARADALRVHFKPTRETAKTLKGMTLKRANKYLWNVIHEKEAVPFRRYLGHTGRHPQGKAFKSPTCGFPRKSSRFLLDLLQNVKANAIAKGLDPSKLVISHIQTNRAPAIRRRTYRAHGRINAYQSSPTHIEIAVTEKKTVVPKPQKAKTPKKLNPKKLESGATAQQ